MPKLIDFKNPMSTVYVVIAFLVLVQVLIVSLPLIFTGFVNLSNIAGLPFASFFQSGGVLYLIVGAFVIKAIIDYFGGGKTSR